MTRWIAAYIAAGLVFAGLDALWLAVLAVQMYQDSFGDMLLETPNMTAAVVFYALYLQGIVFFVVKPALASGSWKTALVHGLLFGLIAYATYDLTNLATLKGFPANVVLPDLAWGMFVTTVAGFAGWAAGRRFS
ncbi:MAG: DUF2177 family protein [Caulobacter sp.]|nr:DUF2177 family protein [Caulobacter sp.]